MNATEAWILENDAITKFTAGQFNEALELFYQTTTIAPGNAQLHFNFALALAKLGETIAALKILKKGLEIERYDKQALRLLSILIEDLKNSDQDIRDIAGIEWIGRFLKIKDLFLNYLDSEQLIVDLFLSSEIDSLYMKDWQSTDDKSITSEVSNKLKNNVIHELLSSPLKLCYKNISLPCLVGSEISDIMDCIVSNYDDLLDSDRSVALIWMFGEGKKKYEDADYEEAAGIFESIAAVEPTNIAILFYCSKTLRESGEMEMIQRSTNYLKRIIQLNPENTLAWYEISLSYAIIGDFQKELFCLQRAFDLGHSKDDFARITYLESIAAPVDPFSN